MKQAGCSLCRWRITAKIQRPFEAGDLKLEMANANAAIRSAGVHECVTPANQPPPFAAITRARGLVSAAPFAPHLLAGNSVRHHEHRAISSLIPARNAARLYDSRRGLPAMPRMRTGLFISVLVVSDSVGFFNQSMILLFSIENKIIGGRTLTADDDKPVA